MAIRPVVPVRPTRPRAAVFQAPPPPAPRPRAAAPLRGPAVEHAQASPSPLDAVWSEYQALRWNGSEANVALKRELLFAIGDLRDARAVAPLAREARSISWNGSVRPVEIKKQLLSALGAIGGEEAATVLLAEYRALGWAQAAGPKRHLLEALARTGADSVADALTGEYQLIGWNALSENVARKRLLLEAIKATRQAAAHR